MEAALRIIFYFFHPTLKTTLGKDQKQDRFRMIVFLARIIYMHMLKKMKMMIVVHMIQIVVLMMTNIAII